MNDSRDFQDAESVRSGQSHVTSQPAFFPFFRDPGGMLSRTLGMPSRKNWPPSIWDAHVFSGNVFANPTAFSSARHPQESTPWTSIASDHTSPHVMSESNTSFGSEMPVRTVSQKFIRPQWGKILKEFLVQINNDCRFRIFILTNSQHQQRLLVGWQDSRLHVLAHSFLRKVCIGSKKWKWLNQWMIFCLRHM